jgi:hypothetical protein
VRRRLTVTTARAASESQNSHPEKANAAPTIAKVKRTPHSRPFGLSEDDTDRDTRTRIFSHPSPPPPSRDPPRLGFRLLLGRLSQRQGRNSSTTLHHCPPEFTFLSAARGLSGRTPWRPLELDAQTGEGSERRPSKREPSQEHSLRPVAPQWRERWREGPSEPAFHLQSATSASCLLIPRSQVRSLHGPSAAENASHFRPGSFS